jgi:hypothetical protein
MPIKQRSKNLPQISVFIFKLLESLSVSSSSILLSEQCKAVAMMDKAEIRAESKRHYHHKEDKLRQQVREVNLMREEIDKEEMKKLQEEEENLIFQLAEESLSPSSEPKDLEHTLQTRLKAFPPSIQKLDYPVNEMELLELKCKLNMGEKLDKTGEMSCGQKVGNRVILRSFHDRLYSEPRGKINLHMKIATESTCLTHQQWLHEISNDPKITVSKAISI